MDHRLRFPEQLLLHCDENPSFINNILFSNEATGKSLLDSQFMAKLK